MLARIPQGWQKYNDERCLYWLSFFCFLTLHAGTVGIHKFLGCLIMLVFQGRILNQLFVVNARNSLKSLAVSTDSESKVEPFITQTKAALVTILQQSFRKNILNLHLRVQTTSKQLTISIFAPTIFRPTCMFTDKEDSGRGITTRKFSRGMRQEYHKTQRGQLHVFMEQMSLGSLVKELNALP